MATKRPGTGAAARSTGCTDGAAGRAAAAERLSAPKDSRTGSPSGARPVSPAEDMPPPGPGRPRPNRTIIIMDQIGIMHIITPLETKRLILPSHYPFFNLYMYIYLGRANDHICSRDGPRRAIGPRERGA